MSVGARTRVAGLEVVPVSLVPADGDHFQRRYWIEPTTGLLLKSATLNAQNQLLESMEFVDVEIEPVDAEIVDAETEESGSPQQRYSQAHSIREVIREELEQLLVSLKARNILPEQSLSEMRSQQGLPQSVQQGSEERRGGVRSQRWESVWLPAGFASIAVDMLSDQRERVMGCITRMACRILHCLLTSHKGVSG